MSSEQLNAFIEAIKDDSALRERIKAASDLDAVVPIAREAGFSVTKAAMLRHTLSERLKLSDAELEVIGSKSSPGRLQTN